MFPEQPRQPHTSPYPLTKKQPPPQGCAGLRWQQQPQFWIRQRQALQEGLHLPQPSTLLPLRKRGNPLGGKPEEILHWGPRLPPPTTRPAEILSLLPPLPCTWGGTSEVWADPAAPSEGRVGRAGQLQTQTQIETVADRQWLIQKCMYSKGPYFCLFVFQFPTGKRPCLIQCSV